MAQVQQPGTIMIVDDEVAITQWVAEALRDEGYSVRVAQDGASALLAMREQAPDLVLLDIAMPVMTGDELLLRLRRGSFPDLPIIVMTAGLHAETFLAQGATYVLPKPIALDTLLEVVAHYIKLQRARTV
jgi:two-component system OmpR family response regulator